MKSEFGIQNMEIHGKVIHGDGYGKVLGFPTANLDRRDYSRRKLNFKFGVYAGWAEFKLNAKNHKLTAAIVIGPLDRKGLPKIEAHIINFSGRLYGKPVGLRLARYLRPFKKYKDTHALKQQIARDVERIKEMEL